MALTVIFPPADVPEEEVRLAALLSRLLQGREHRLLRRAEELKDLTGQRLLFAVPLGWAGVNMEHMRMLRRLRSTPNLLEDCTAGVITDGGSELYTKSAATELALAANFSGCALVGRPLVEGTGSLKNFRVQAEALHSGLSQTYYHAAEELLQRVCSFALPKKAKPYVLTLHASSHGPSNTLALWSGVRRRLMGQCELREIGLRNGAVYDCSGCPYTMCVHFGERDGCFYGGVISEAVYPAVRRADVIVMVCPNYNDALSANLTAFVNRLTALFRQTRFYDKALFSIIVSGYSGGDIIARQIIGGLNMNKSFYLPGRFALLETANDPGEALSLEGVEDRLDQFARQILDSCKKQ